MNDNIPGYPKYHVTERGKLFSRKWKNEWRQLTPWIDKKTGYVKASVSGRTVSLHTLVLLAHAGSKPGPDYMCRHLDGNKLNNQVTNLKWGTAQENSDDKALHGTKIFGTKSVHSKFTDSDIVFIFEKYSHGMTKKQIARMFTRKPQTIVNILKRKVWKHVLISANTLEIVSERLSQTKTSYKEGLISKETKLKVLQKIAKMGFLNFKTLVKEFALSHSSIERIIKNKDLKTEYPSLLDGISLVPRTVLLNDCQVRAIFAEYTNTQSLWQIKRKFNIDKKTAKKILKRQILTDVYVNPDLIDQCALILKEKTLD